MNHYKMLGVPETASLDEIKKAYRDLVLQHHPDKGGDVKMIQRINEAKEVLSDPQKRKEYDDQIKETNAEGSGSFGNFGSSGDFGSFGNFGSSWDSESTEEFEARFKAELDAATAELDVQFDHFFSASSGRSAGGASRRPEHAWNSCAPCGKGGGGRKGKGGGRKGKGVGGRYGKGGGGKGGGGKGKGVGGRYGKGGGAHESFRCNLCQVTLNSEPQFQEHINGRPHQAKKAMCQRYR